MNGLQHGEMNTDLYLNGFSYKVPEKVGWQAKLYIWKYILYPNIAVSQEGYKSKWSWELNSNIQQSQAAQNRVQFEPNIIEQTVQVACCI